LVVNLALRLSIDSASSGEERLGGQLEKATQCTVA